MPEQDKAQKIKKGGIKARSLPREGLDDFDYLAMLRFVNYGISFVYVKVIRTRTTLIVNKKRHASNIKNVLDKIDERL